MSQDPIEEEGGLNLYGFCYNSTVSYYDYLGGLPLEMEALTHPTLRVLPKNPKGSAYSASFDLLGALSSKFSGLSFSGSKLSYTKDVSKTVNPIPWKITVGAGISVSLKKCISSDGKRTGLELSLEGNVFLEAGVGFKFSAENFNPGKSPNKQNQNGNTERLGNKRRQWNRDQKNIKV